MKTLRYSSSTFLFLCAGLASAAGSDQVLVHFSSNSQLSQLRLTDAQVSLEKSGASPLLRITTGHTQPWPGVTLFAPAGHWDVSQSAQISLAVRNPGTNSVNVFCRVDNPGADGTQNCASGSVGLDPGGAGTLKVTLKRSGDDTLGGKLFGMRGYPVASGGPGTIDPSNVTQLLIFVSRPEADHVFEIGDIRAVGAYTPPTAWVTDATPFFPFIDTFGQYLHKEWPGKTKSLADLASKRDQEAKDLATQPGPKDWDKFGGSANGPRLQATGFFRTEKVGRKWWLVDPDGHLFFSHALDCVGTQESTPIEERETWFTDFPGNQPEFAQFLSTGFALKGHYAGRSPKCFSFDGANCLRKYGPDWGKTRAEIIHKRLRSWGLNTIGNWSDESVFRLRLTPYTDAISSGRTKMLEGSEGYWGKFPDVFDP